MLEFDRDRMSAVSNTSPKSCFAIRARFCVVPLLLLFTLCSAPALAQDPAAGSTRVPVDTRADEFDFDQKTGMGILKGNAVIIRQDSGATLRADEIRFNQKTGKGVARGNVVVTEDGKEWRGDELEYDINNKRFRGRGGGASGKRSIYSEDPFTLSAMSFDQVSDDQYVLRDVEGTTCDPNDPYPPYRVRAKKMVVTPGERIKGYGTSIYFGRVPVMWTPYWTKNLNEDTGWHFQPGFNSRLGGFLLSSYRTPLNDYLRSESHIDFYSDRGVGVGQDFGWRDPVDGSWHGEISGYYIDDDMPFEDDEIETDEVEAERYRIRVEHFASFSPNDYFLADFSYLSDPDVLEDFFDREYRGSAIPDNFASFTHRDDWYTAELLLRPRLNDFYEVTARTPEGSVTFPRQRIADSPYFYEGKTQIGYLERLFAEDSTSDDYSSLRLDSRNTLLYPTKQAGFLNVIPRIGYRATYYSDTRDEETETPLVLGLVTNEVVETDGSTSTVVVAEFIEGDPVTRQVEGSGDLRNIVEFGVESSFKAFGMYESSAGEPLRHVVEPRVNYTYVPEPDLAPDDLLPFDSIDGLNEKHTITFGLRNKMQAKRFGRSHDLIDVDARTTLLIEDVNDTGNDFTPLEIDAEITAADWADVEVFISYDFEESLLERLNSEVHLRSGGPWSSDIEYRYRERDDDTTSLLLGEIIYTPNPEWSFSLYGRHEFEKSELEEVAIEVQRTLDCLAWRAGVGVVPRHTRSDGSERDDEWHASIEFWLTDFPDVGFGAR